MKGFLQRILKNFMKKKYLEHQTLGRRNVFPIGPANYILDWQIYGRINKLWKIQMRFHKKVWSRCEWAQDPINLCLFESLHFPSLPQDTIADLTEFLNTELGQQSVEITQLIFLTSKSISLTSKIHFLMYFFFKVYVF